MIILTSKRLTNKFSPQQIEQLKVHLENLTMIHAKVSRFTPELIKELEYIDDDEFITNYKQLKDTIAYINAMIDEKTQARIQLPLTQDEYEILRTINKTYLDNTFRRK